MNINHNYQPKVQMKKFYTFYKTTFVLITQCSCLQTLMSPLFNNIEAFAKLSMEI